MITYNPQKPLNPVDWLQLPEFKKEELVHSYYYESGIDLSDKQILGIVEIENQVAFGGNASLEDQIENYLKSGLTREKALISLADTESPKINREIKSVEKSNSLLDNSEYILVFSGFLGVILFIWGFIKMNWFLMIVGTILMLPLSLESYLESSVQRAQTLQKQLENISKSKEDSISEQSEMIRCVMCGSNQINAQKKGYGAIKGLAAGAVVGPLGLAAGFHGSRNVQITCLNCGHTWKPKKS